MRLFDPEGERIIAGIFALGAGEEFAPGFDVALVERIGAGADLQDYGVELRVNALVEDGDGLGLLLVGAETFLAWPVDVADGRNPGGAELALGGRGLGRGCGFSGVLAGLGWRQLIRGWLQLVGGGATDEQ
jgi:hypothetical protein